MPKKNYSGGIPINIRLPAWLHEAAEQAATQTGLSKVDVLRLAMEAGLEDMERVNYRIGSAISHRANPEKEAEQRDGCTLEYPHGNVIIPDGIAAEEQAPYGKGKSTN